MARETIFHPAQKRHYSSNAPGRHPRGCPTGAGLTRTHVSMPWGVKSITNLPRYNAQRNKSPAIAVSDLVRSAASVRSLCQLDDESSEAHCAFCDQPLPANDLGNDPAQPHASRVVAQLERCRCPILDTLVPKSYFFR